MHTWDIQSKTCQKIKEEKKMLRKKKKKNEHNVFSLFLLKRTKLFICHYSEYPSFEYSALQILWKIRRLAYLGILQIASQRVCFPKNLSLDVKTGNDHDGRLTYFGYRLFLYIWQR